MGLSGVKNMIFNLVYLSGLFFTIFTATLPDLKPIESATYQAVKLNKQLFFSVDVARDSTYGANMIIYAGNDYVGSLPIPQVGHRVTTATFDLPPEAINKSDLTVTVYWKVEHWTSIIWPQELFYRVTVQDPLGGNK